MSSALKLDPRWPEPGLLHGDERVQPAHVGEELEGRVAIRAGGADPVEARSSGSA